MRMIALMFIGFLMLAAAWVAYHKGEIMHGVILTGISGLYFIGVWPEEDGPR